MKGIAYRKSGSSGGWPEYDAYTRDGEKLGHISRVGEYGWYIVVNGTKFPFQRKEDCGTALGLAWFLVGAGTKEGGE